jgi:hypothetical protein
VGEGTNVVAIGTLYPKYSCIALTSDDWCWAGAPQILPLVPFDGGSSGDASAE